MENYLGQVQTFGFGYAPAGWATCDGQTMTIQQNTALYSLLGTAYGGNGSTNFVLPDLRGRTMVHQGSGSGLSTRSLGQTGGVENVTLNTGNLAAHTHSLMALNGASTTSTPGGNVLATSSGTGSDNEPIPVTVYAPAGALTPMAAAAVATVGNSQPVATMPPFVVVNVCIALQGNYPPRS